MCILSLAKIMKPPEILTQGQTAFFFFIEREAEGHKVGRVISEIQVYTGEFLSLSKCYGFHQQIKLLSTGNSRKLCFQFPKGMLRRMYENLGL